MRKRQFSCFEFIEFFREVITLEKWRSILTSLSDRVDLPGHITAHLPYLTMVGFGEITVDLQQGLVSYADTEIVVKVALGMVCIQGGDLYISLMREGRITVKGRIDAITFRREVMP